MSATTISTSNTNETSLWTYKIRTTRIWKKIQYNTEDTLSELTPLQKNHIQKICGSSYYNGQSVDSTQLHALNELSIKATTATEETQKALTQFLNYCASNPDATIIYRSSNMILSCNSNDAYLVAPKSRS